MVRKRLDLPPMSPEDTAKEFALRNEANKLIQAGRNQEAQKLFDAARKLRLTGAKASKKWENRYGNFKLRNFQPLLTDDEGDIGILRVTMGTWELLLNEEVVRTIRGIRFSVKFLDRHDQRIPDIYKDEPSEISFLDQELTWDVEGWKLRNLIKGIEELREQIGALSSIEKDRSDLGLSFFDKVDNGNMLADFSFNLDNTPKIGIGSLPYYERGSINDLFISDTIPKRETDLAIKAVRIGMAKDPRSRITGTVRSGGSGKRKS